MSRDPNKHPWIVSGVVMTRALLERVHEEARKAYARDEESCGLLLGPAVPHARAEGESSDRNVNAVPLRVDEILPMTNRARALHELDPETYPRTARMYFDIDPLKFQRAVEAGEARGRPVKVLYHSHLDVGAYFSETDADAAKMGGQEPAYDLAYLVTSVREGAVDDHKLFVWDEATSAFVDAPLMLVEDE